MVSIFPLVIYASISLHLSSSHLCLAILHFLSISFLSRLYCLSPSSFAAFLYFPLSSIKLGICCDIQGFQLDLVFLSICYSAAFTTSSFKATQSATVLLSPVTINRVLLLPLKLSATSGSFNSSTSHLFIFPPFCNYFSFNLQFITY